MMQTALAQNTHYQSQNEHTKLLKPGVSELMIPAWEQASFELLLPMLSHLSHQAEDRWLTWIGKPCLSKDIAQAHQLNRSNVRMINSQSDQETLWLMWDALNNGTSAFVVASFQSTQSVTHKERSLLEAACNSGHARALVVKFPDA